MTDRVYEVGAVERVEVECFDAFVDQIHRLFGRDGGGNKVRRRGIVFQAFKTSSQPRWYGRAGADCKARDLTEIMDRHEPWNDRHPDAGSRARSKKRR